MYIDDNRLIIVTLCGASRAVQTPDLGARGYFIPLNYASVDNLVEIANLNKWKVKPFVQNYYATSLINHVSSDLYCGCSRPSDPPWPVKSIHDPSRNAFFKKIVPRPYKVSLSQFHPPSCSRASRRSRLLPHRLLSVSAATRFTFAGTLCPSPRHRFRILLHCFRLHSGHPHHHRRSHRLFRSNRITPWIVSINFTTTSKIHRCILLAN